MIDRKKLSKLSVKFNVLNIGDFLTTTPPVIYDLMGPGSQKLQIYKKTDDKLAVTVRMLKGVLTEISCPTLFKEDEEVIPLSL